MTYSAAISHSSSVADKPRLSRNRLARPRDALEQAEVLHITRADLDNVGGVLDGVGVVGVHQLSDDADARARARLPQDIQTRRTRNAVVPAGYAETQALVPYMWACQRR